MSQKDIRILFVDDSEVIIQILSAIFKAEPGFKIVGVAKNGLEAIKLTEQLKPDVITMDIEMNEMNGIQATKHIMSHTPTPIVVLSAHTNKNEPNNAFEALQYGALTVVKKPENILDKGFDKEKTKLIKLVKAMSEIKVITRRTHSAPPDEDALKQRIKNVPVNTKLIALGASTGGPEALSRILKDMQPHINLPIVIVLHIAAGFLPGYITWLERDINAPIKIASHYEILEPGHIYFAPDGKHLTVKNKTGEAMAYLTSKDRTHAFMPSITVLFNSLADAFPNMVVAGLLTGMGRDGADGLLDLNKAKCFTFIQSKASSVIYGMPGQAKSLHAAELEIDLEDIGPFLARIMKN